MKKSKSHIDQLSPKVIKDYLSNNLSNKERHEVEKHLLDNELGQDALEGYEEADFDFDEDLQEISQSLASRIEQNASNRWRYLGIAASLLILMVSALFIINFPDVNEKLAITESDNAEIYHETEEILVPQEPVSSTNAVNDSIIEELSRPESSVGVEIVEESSKSPQEVGAVVADAYSDPEPIRQLPELTESEDDEEKPATRSHVLSALSTAKEIPSGAGEESESVSERGLPSKLDYAESASPANQGFGSDDYYSDAIETEAKATRSTRSLSKKAETPITVNEPAPRIGMPKYREYLENQLIYPNQAALNEVEGTVKVSFEVQPDGSLSTIRVIEGLGFGCDEEAIRLVEEGPEWTPASTSEGAISRVVLLEIFFTLPK